MQDQWLDYTIIQRKHGVQDKLLDKKWVQMKGCVRIFFLQATSALVSVSATCSICNDFSEWIQSTYNRSTHQKLPKNRMKIQFLQFSSI